MRRLRNDAAGRYLRERGIPALPAPRAVGDYGENPAKETELLQGAILDVEEPPLFRNRNSFTLYAFALSTGSGNNGAVLIVPANERRNFLLIQNQSEADDMFFNLSGDASPTSGVLLPKLTMIVFDFVCPYNGVSVFMNAATLQPGAVMEGTPLP